MFLAIAKSRSLSEAGLLIGASQPTVSRGIKRLEDLIGEQLVIINNKGISLTLAGHSLAEYISRIDADIDQFIKNIHFKRDEVGGVVRISITDGICGIFVSSHVEEFSNKYPKISLKIRAPLNIHDIRENMTDIVVTFIRPNSSEFIVADLGQINLIPVASNKYVKSHGMPDLNNIHNHRFVDSDIYNTESEAWSRWRSLLERGRIVHTCENSFSYGLIVRSGAGIGLLGNFVMAEPSMVPVNLGFSVGLPLYAVALRERLRSKPVRVVFEWLSAILGPHVPWLSKKDDPHLLPDARTKLVFANLLASLSGTES